MVVFSSQDRKVFFSFKLKAMAQDASGKKFNRIPKHTKKVGGKTVTVKEHIRSNPRTSTGKK